MKDTPLVVALVILCFPRAASPQLLDTPQRAVPDPGVVTTGQAITPAGVPTIINGRVYGISFGASSAVLLVSSNSALLQLDWRKNALIAQHQWKGIPGLQSLCYDTESAQAITVVAASATSGKPPRVDLFSMRDGVVDSLVSGLGAYTSGALATAAKAHVAAIPLTHDNALAVVNLDFKTLIARIPTGIAPFGAAVNGAGTVAYVTNWGGRVATGRDRTATSGDDRVVIDRRGIASSGTVTRIDIPAAKITQEIGVGLHPTAILWNERNNRLFVANSNDDSVSVIDTLRNRVVRTISLQPFAQRVHGVAPTALALSLDGRRLFVACGGINAVAQIDPATGVIEGLIPAAWYPSSLALSPDGKYLAIGTLFGVGAGARKERDKRSVFAERGSVHIVELPDADQLASFTTAVSQNNHLALPGTTVAAASESRAPLPVPARSGDPSLIEHVVLIIKENRTYDQVLGDMKKGNSDPSLVMFGEDVTPNHHRLADQFVLLDNFYATGGVSGDGHQWLTQANETAYAMWPGYKGRSYPFDGTDPIAYSKAGFLWDLAIAHKKTVRVYGEFTPSMALPLDRRRQYLDRWQHGADFSAEFKHQSPIPPLDHIMAHEFPGFSNAIPDVVRAQIFLKELEAWQKQGSMPDLTLLQLNCDHTVGTFPGGSTPKAMVADNDLSLGETVDALSHSRFWPRMAIFVVEDDAQDGVDHVDGHRTVALAISPYTRRGSVDSTFYAHQSILKSIELMLGLPTLSIFDLIATDMRNAFQATPDLRAYSAVQPKQSLFEQNPPTATLHGPGKKDALASARMRFDIPDAAPANQLNRILWRSARGSEAPYPKTKRAVFVPMIHDDDDADEDDHRR